MVTYERPPSKSERPKDWLRYISNKGNDLRWLEPYEDHLVNLTRKYIYTPWEFKDATRLLMTIVPYFVYTLAHTENWLPVMISALLQAQDLKHNDLQVEIFNALGEAYLKNGNHKGAHGNFETALERAEESFTPEMMLASYTGLFKLQWFDLANPVTPHMVKRALEIAQSMNNQVFKANLHDSLARAYSRLGETRKALEHGQITYIYWNAIGNHQSEFGWTAYLLVTIYRNIALQYQQPVCLSHAEYFLKVAREQIGTTEYEWQDTLLAYQTGALYLQRHENERAAEWFTAALKKARQSGRNDVLALAYHGLGLAQTELRAFAQSRENLQSALQLWQKLDNAYEQASTLQALGYLEGLDGHTEQALNYLHMAWDICEKLSDTPQRTFLLENIRLSIDEL